MKQYLTTKEMAERHGVSPRRFLQLVKELGIPRLPYGQPRFDPIEVELIMKQKALESDVGQLKPVKRSAKIPALNPYYAKELGLS